MSIARYLVDMAISSETWAIVAATGLGPLFAVGITLWREKVRALYSRRLHVFRTLMSTRKLAISNEHVSAVNLIEVDFYKCASVEEAWNTYKNHLNDRSKPEDDTWREKRDNLLARLLCEMGKILNFDMPAIEIFRSGYAPEGWVYRETRSGAIAEYIVALSTGKATVPMNVLSFPVDENFAKSQVEFFRLASERLREQKASDVPDGPPSGKAATAP